MKRRIRKIANFFAFNLLFFALYLNFIHKDQAAINFAAESAKQQNAAFSGTVMVNNPQDAKKAVINAEPKADAANTSALKLSIN